MLTLTPASVAAGALITRWGRYRWALWTGWGLVTLAEGLTIRWDAHTRAGEWLATSMLLGLGHGLLLTAHNCASQATAPSGDEGAATAFYALVRSLGMAMGVGIIACVFLNVIRAKCETHQIPPDVAANITSYAVRLKSMAPGHLRSAIMETYAGGFQGTSIFLSAVAGVAFSACVWVRGFEIDKELSSDHHIISSRQGVTEEQSHMDVVTKAG